MTQGEEVKNNVERGDCSKLCLHFLLQLAYFFYSKELCLLSFTCNIGLRFIVLGQALFI